MSLSGPRIGLVSVYFGLFDQSMPPSFRADRLDHAERLAVLLGDHGDVVFPGLVDSAEAGADAGRALAQAGVDIVVCAPSMAAPPSYAWAALEAMPDAPVVVVAAQEGTTVPDDYDTEAATRRSLPVGVVMITNVLVRRERDFITVIGTLGDAGFETGLGATLQGVAAASRLRKGRLLALGSPIAGYWDVEASPEELSALGVTVVDAGADDISEAFARAEAEEVNVEIRAASDRFDVESLPGDVLERSARLTVALRKLCSGDIIGGAVNCHGDVLRFNNSVGITACLAVTILTSEAVPFACTGDIPTGIALALGRGIADWALYCELYQLDLDGDWLLVANGGEGDPGAAASRVRPCLLPEDHYLGDRGAGTAVSFPVKQGPATLISLTPTSGNRWALVAATGEIIDARHDGMEGPNGMFRFQSGPVDQGFARWCEAGATHHAALLKGHQAQQLAAAASTLRIELRNV